MPKHVIKLEEVKRRKEEEEEESEESSEEESSNDESSDSDSSESSDNSSESSGSSDDSSDSSDDSSEEESEEPKKKAHPVVVQGTKNKRAEEDSAKTQPEKKKSKKDDHTNGHANGHANGHHTNGNANGHATPKKVEKLSKDVEKWREENQLTVVTIKDELIDPTPPYAEFSDAPFPSYITESIKSFGFKKPTPIQAQSWPLTMEGRDVVGIAETGSGKTLAFGYPALIKIKSLKKPLEGPKVLVLAPTRELAQQIDEVLSKACVPADLKTVCVFGGVDKRNQSVRVKKADIIIATPGRLIDLIQDKSANLKNVRYLVFDEADRMLDMGFIPQIRAIVDTIPKDVERQTQMFSATWPTDVQKFAHTYLKDPVQITIGAAGERLKGAKKVSQVVEVCAKETLRKSAIKNLLKRLCADGARPKILLFMLYKNTCDALYEELVREKWNVEILHGGKSQNIRDKSMSNFKTGKAHILIATDVAARGLDIKDVKYVINGEMPLVMEDYIHRIGRTGRAGESGTAYTIVSPDDKVHARQLVRILEEGSHNVPPELAKIAETAPVTKPRKSTMELLYGDFAKGADAEQMLKKPTKITFD